MNPLQRHDLQSWLLLQELLCPCLYLQAKVLGAAAMAGYKPAVEFVCSPYTHSLSTRDITRDPDLRGVVFQLAVAQPEGCKPAAGSNAGLPMLPFAFCWAVMVHMPLHGDAVRACQCGNVDVKCCSIPAWPLRLLLV